jgi:hypothetical protein
MPQKQHRYNLDEIEEFLTLSDKQKIYVNALREYGTIRETARRLGKSRSTTRNMFDFMESKLARVKLNPKVPTDQILKGTTTLYKTDEETGKEVKSLQWVKTEKSKQEQLEAITNAIKLLTKGIKPVPPKKRPHTKYQDQINVYISNDIHFGALMWKDETLDRNWDLKIAEDSVASAYDYLIGNAPSTREAIVVDLGDLTEQDNNHNMTPKSGNILAVDGRYQKVFKAAYTSLIRAIDKALEKHEIVYFVNIAGNHDLTTGLATREVISAWYRNEPRVIVDDKPNNIKYFHYGKVLFQFAHGDEMKMSQAGEAMAVDMIEVFSQTVHRYAYFGHNHKDKVLDGAICKSESFRNLAPLNHWAANNGYRRGLGTMQCITHSKEHGEINRTTYNVGMEKAS